MGFGEVATLPQTGNQFGVWVCPFSPSGRGPILLFLSRFLFFFVLFFSLVSLFFGSIEFGEDVTPSPPPKPKLIGGILRDHHCALATGCSQPLHIIPLATGNLLERSFSHTSRSIHIPNTLQQSRNGRSTHKRFHTAACDSPGRAAVSRSHVVLGSLSPLVENTRGHWNLFSVLSYASSLVLWCGVWLYSCTTLVSSVQMSVTDDASPSIHRVFLWSGGVSGVPAASACRES